MDVSGSYSYPTTHQPTLPPALAAGEFDGFDGNISEAFFSSSDFNSDFIQSSSQLRPQKSCVPEPASYILNSESFEFLKSAGLLYADVQTTVESTDTPTSEIDMEALERREFRFLDTRHTTRWEKKKIVVSYSALSPYSDSADFYLAEGLFLSFLQDNFTLYFFVGDNLVEIKNTKDIRKYLPSLNWASYDTVLDKASKHMSREQLFWINWSNIRSLNFKMNPLKSGARPNLFEGHEGLHNSLETGELTLDLALGILQHNQFELTYSGEEKVCVKINLDLDKLEDIFLLFSLLPENSQIILEERNLKLTPLILERLPLESVSLLSLKLNRFGKMDLKAKKDIEKIVELAKAQYEIPLLLQKLRELQASLPKPRKTKPSISLNLTSLIDAPNATVIFNPDFPSHSQNLRVSARTEIISLHLPLESFRFEVDGLENLRDLRLYPTLGKEPLTTAIMDSAAKAFASVILKSSRTLECLDIVYPEVEGLSSEEINCLEHYFEILFEELSKGSFPELKEVGLREMPLCSETFLCWLEKCPKLDALILDRIEVDISSNEFFPKVSLPTRTLDLSFSDLDPDFVNSLLKMMPNLKIFCAPCFNPYPEDLVPLYHLDAMSIGSENISSDFTFWSAYPCLEHLVTYDDFDDFGISPEILRLTIIAKEKNLSVAGFSHNSGLVKANYSVTPVFKDIAYREHRESLHKVSYENGAVKVSDLSADFTPYQPPLEATAATFQGETTLLVQSGTYTPLPGLSSNDTLLNPQAKGVDLEQLEFGFDPNLKVYGVRLKSTSQVKHITLTYQIMPGQFFRYHPSFTDDTIPPGEIGVSFNETGVELDNQKWASTDPLLRLNALIFYLRNFKVGQPNLPENASEQESLNTLLRSQCGAACEGRSQLFCMILPHIMPAAEAIMVKNPCHAYVQLRIANGTWDIDLGGYPADVTVKEPTKIDETPQPVKTAPKLEKGENLSTEASKAGYKEYAVDVIRQISQSKTGKPQALLIAKPSNIPHLHQAFIKASKQEQIKFAFLAIDRRQIYGSKIVNGQFLRASSAQKEVLETGGVLFLDLSGLSATNIATLLQLSDPYKRKIGDLWISPETLIVAVMPDNKSASSDIGRRFGLIQEAPTKTPFLNKLGPVVDESDTKAPENALTLDLFFDPTGWKMHLLGRLNDKMEWQEGLLIQAIRENRPLVIYNLPDHPDLHACLRDLDTGEIYFSGERISIPSGFKVFKRTLEKKDLTINVASGIYEADFFLSPETFSQFIAQVSLEGGSIEPRPGILEASMESEISVLVMENLSDWQWRKLLDRQLTWQATVTFFFPEGFSPPPFLTVKQGTPRDSSWETFPGLFKSSDAEYTLKTIKQTYPDAIEIPVVAHSRGSQFLPKVVNKSHTEFKFELEKGRLFELLEQGATLILYGPISQSLLNELAPLMAGKQKGALVNGSFLPVTGNLILIQETSKSQLTFTPQSVNPNFEQLLPFLPPKYPEGEVKVAKALLEQNGLNVTMTSLERLMLYRNQGIEDPLSYFKADGTRAVLYESRAEEVMKAFHASPILYIYGPPASGKSHFILEALPKVTQAKFFHGINRIEAFLEDSDASILCLDEGDLNPELIQELMGLQHQPRSFYFKRKFYELKSFKGVILTGNGQFAGRKDLAFIKTFGGALYFPAIPIPKIKESLLAPLLPNDPIGKAFLSQLIELYQAAKVEEKPIELRHLRSMAAAFHFYHFHNPDWSGTEIAKIAFDDYCPGLNQLKASSEQFDSIRCIILDEILSKSRWNNQFILTKSRKPIVFRIMMAAWIRSLNFSGFQRGFLLEGAAGEGKTDLVKQALFALGDTPFEQIDMSDEPAIVRDKLYKAFHAGKIIVVDEFDGLYEAEMNAYLTGFDLDGKPAEKTGFFIFATANGNSYPFRLPRSKALDSRFIKETITPYSSQELASILCTKGTSKEQAAMWVQEHLSAIEDTPYEILLPTAADLFSRMRELSKKPRRNDEHSLSPKRSPAKRVLHATQ